MVVLIGLLIAFNVTSRDTPREPQIGFYDVYLQQPTYPVSWVITAKGDACWDELIMRESGWRTDAVNRTSGAYGLPQSLPPEKMAEAGDDWRTNPETQLKWMYEYLQKRYNGTCNGLKFQIENGWY